MPDAIDTGEGMLAIETGTDTSAPPEPTACNKHGGGFSQLYRRYFKTLVNNLKTAYGDGPPDPEEVAQHAFEKLHARGNMDALRDPEAFVWISARNIIMSEKRTEKVRRKHQPGLELFFSPEACDRSDPERVLIAREQVDEVMKALEAMPGRRREIFLLNRIHGLSPREAGQRCGVSRSAAVRHIALATAAIAEALMTPGQRDTA